MSSTCRARDAGQERLDVYYQRAIEFLAFTSELAEELLRGLIERARYDRGLAVLEAVVAMLTKTIRVDSAT